MPLNKTAGLAPEALGYVNAYNDEHPALTAIREGTVGLERQEWQIPEHQGAFMGWLIKAMGARDVLELGTYTGYSTAAMALALSENGKIITCDIADGPLNAVGLPAWQEAGIDHKISFRKGKALETLGDLAAGGGMFDFAFIDAHKPEYPAYYMAVRELMCTGGIIMLDNTLWHGGRVADPEFQDEPTLAMREVNDMIWQDAEDRIVNKVMLPMADGITLVEVL